MKSDFFTRLETFRTSRFLSFKSPTPVSEVSSSETRTNSVSQSRRSIFVSNSEMLWMARENGMSNDVKDKFLRLHLKYGFQGCISTMILINVSPGWNNSDIWHDHHIIMINCKKKVRTPYTLRRTWSSIWTTVYKWCSVLTDFLTDFYLYWHDISN